MAKTSNNWSYFVSKLDRVFSKWLRLFHADEDGMVQCYTCDNRIYWTDLDCGHFRRRKHITTRWHVKNCKPQCKDCNQVNDGMEEVFAKNLENEYGPGIVENLTNLSLQTIKLPVSELKKQIKDYELKLQELGHD